MLARRAGYQRVARVARVALFVLLAGEQRHARLALAALAQVAAVGRGARLGCMLYFFLNDFKKHNANNTRIF